MKLLQTLFLTAMAVVCTGVAAQGTTAALSRRA